MMSCITPQSHSHGMCGTIIIAVMWLVIVLAALVLIFARTVRVETAASANFTAGLQAEAAARGALHYLLAQIDGTDGVDIPDCASDGGAMQVGEGFFWILKPSAGYDYYDTLFGIRDEASRLNLNTATRVMLMRIPEVSDELADAIVAWRDPNADDAIGDYLLRDDPYYSKNAPFETVEELMLISGATERAVFGDAHAGNAFAVSDEIDTTSSDVMRFGGSFELLTGGTSAGIFHYLTVYSREMNTSYTRERRVNVNNAGTDAISELLRDVVPAIRLPEVMSRINGGRPFQSIFDFYFRSQLTFDEFSRIADEIATSADTTLRGLVNINTAPRQVLLCLPGLDENDVDTLITARQSYDIDTANIAWVANVLPREKALALGNLITARSFQFSADILAVSGNGRAFRRYRTVIDATSSPPRVLYWKNLTHLGWSLEEDVLQQLRAGE